jgi:hypothetical protein
MDWREYVELTKRILGSTPKPIVHFSMLSSYKPLPFEKKVTNP